MKSVRAKPESLRLPLRGAVEAPSFARRAAAKADWIAAVLVIGVVLVPMPVAARVAGVVAIALVWVGALALRASAAIAA